MATPQQDVSVLRQPPLVWLTITRPAVKNAIRFDTYTALSDALDSAERDDEI